MMAQHSAISVGKRRVISSERWRKEVSKIEARQNFGSGQANANPCDNLDVDGFYLSILCAHSSK